jgi:methylenetetrahydrofolate dehydrogenase (NADP+)/methenyltetrahydrofolate cyclohydrolase
MIIDGKLLSDAILSRLSGEVTMYKTQGIIPTLAVIQIGDNPASMAYIKQKQKAAERIGANLIFNHQPAAISKDKFKNLVQRYNSDPNVQGIIIQRPVPKEMGDVSTILDSIRPEKDIDGFLPNSPFDVPVAVAIGEILKSIHVDMDHAQFVVIGRGETAGAPIARYLEKRHCATSVIHSQTPDPEKIMKNADVIISCVGKSQVVAKKFIKAGAILISVGIWRDDAGKLHGDYDEADIATVASAYTPTPGGVGPVNVACLMQNLIKACTL